MTDERLEALARAALVVIFLFVGLLLEWSGHVLDVMILLISNELFSRRRGRAR